MLFDYHRNDQSILVEVNFICIIEENSAFGAMKQRLDILLLENKLVTSREQAHRLILAGNVFVNDQNNVKAGHRIDVSSRLEVRGQEKFVSRGGIKLEGAIEKFQTCVSNKVCADVGTSTGGFTDCLLQHGALKVFAIDVGKSQIHERLRKDDRVNLIEQTNARFMTAETLPETPAIIVVDVSFISITKIIEGLRNISDVGTELILLIKPQFEANQKEVSKGKGIVSDPQTHFSILCNVCLCALNHGFLLLGLDSCVLPGVNGNHEWVAHFVLSEKELCFEECTQQSYKLISVATKARWSLFEVPTSTTLENSECHI